VLFPDKPHRSELYDANQILVVNRRLHSRPDHLQLQLHSNSSSSSSSSSRLLIHPHASSIIQLHSSSQLPAATTTTTCTTAPFQHIHTAIQVCTFRHHIHIYPPAGLTPFLPRL